MRVTQQSPDTWRVRSLASLLCAHGVTAWAVSTMQRLSDGAGVFARLRQVSRTLLARIHKARSATQTPSALERHAEELVALHLAGVPEHQLLEGPVAIQQLIVALTPAPASSDAVLAAIETADATEAEEEAAERRLLRRAAQTGTMAEGDLDELEARTRADIAADTAKLATVQRWRTVLRAGRQAGRAVTFPRPLGGRQPA